MNPGPAPGAASARLPRAALAPRGPVLTRLALLKLRGVVRKQLRRLRTPTGILFAFVGVGLAASWIVSLSFGAMAAGSHGAPVPQPHLVRLLLFMFLVVNVFAHLGQRGLYLQPAELDLLLSAPVSRARILGHRLMCAFGRATAGAVLLGAAASFRVPTATGAFLGALCLTVGLTLLGQGVSLAAAQVERWVPLRLLDVAGKIGVALVAAAFVALALAPPSFDDLNLLELAQSPVLGVLTWPLEPLVATFLAATPGAALSNGLPLLGLMAVFFELLRRWSFDWREVAVTTSGRLGARIARARRLGTGASAANVSRWAARRRIPWVVGRGPLGAVFWRKSASILRRARVTLLFAGLTLALGVGGLLAVTREFEHDTGWAASLLIVFGSVYLTGGLRFDLREDLDRIEELKAWPLSSRRLFLALLVPQITVVGGFLALGCVILTVVGGGGPIPLACALAFLPVFLTGWVATDNLFFLLWPVRIVPGADGMLQDVGRTSILFLCRGVVAGGVLALSALLGWGAFRLSAGSGLGEDLRLLLATPAVLAGLGVWAAVALRLGGRALARFDPSRLES
ncbi:hypothetical protein Pla163_14960 [Planctomycetes bacterium Pla163]|uniref:Uncharacterized protein n=1 Tax=Rohdeia mirabilis TaxID=2528008 RepID=A0A518CYT0_9BACT|nr:hypothetical protein Pla163_14960 [Planctomycetes bacterium Pla163]